ncbi:unnamed protein product [Linum trigynum]|uniref:Uncharacterized protein n=1 Tax=Linum trigynum TaxID=586398 RepID=A0AAV2CN73_9ROSI
MSTTVVVGNQNAAGIDRDSASFPLTQWGGRFLDDEEHQQQGPLPVLESEYEVLKEEVRKMVTAEDDGKPSAIAQKLRVIDAVQRLGIGYHFEKEIEEALEKVHALGDELFVIIHDHDDNTTTDDLYNVSLRFRLLRQQGLRVSPDGFRNLKDGEGNFKGWLASDEQGLLSLYEAAHVAIHGEGILDEALSFATKTLKSILPKLSPSFHKQVKFALGLPSWKCVPRSLTRNYIDFYSEDVSHNHKLLRFAKLDFNLLQKLHRQELHEISEWWKSLNVTTNFPHARDRVVECYYWIYAVYFEPKYQLARVMCTKIISMLSLLDDTCDNFATFEEVKMLTEAIESFHVSALEALPETMKNLYRIIIDLYDEIEMELAKTGPTFAVDYAKEELKKICRAHLAEVQWRTKDHVPTLEEYKIDAYVTSGFPILCTSAFVGMGVEIATREAFEWVTNEPKMVRAASVISRIQNDIVSHKWERERSHAASAIECYMKEHGASEEEAIEFCWEEISRAWKDIAEECQKPTPLPVALTDRVLNFARSISVIYENGDGYTHSHLLKAHIASLFADPVPL